MSFITIPVRIEGAFYKNTAAGYLSLVKNTPGSFPNGEDNTALGYLSLSQNTTGEGNSALGSNSLAFNVSGRFNVAIGERASYNNTTGQFNVSVGSTALNSSTSSDYNTAIGYGACGVLAGNVGSNTMVGAGAGAVMTTGAKNTILGRYNGNQGGLDIRTASNYCVISDGDGNPRIIVDPAGLVSSPGGFSGGGGGGGAITIDNKTAAYTVVSADLGKIINCTANTFTVSLTAAATLGSGFNCWIWNTGSGTITIDPSGTQTIDGLQNLTLRTGEGMQIVCDGANWQTGDKKTMRGYAENIQASSGRPNPQGSESVAIGRSATTTTSGSLQTALGPFSQAQGDYSIALGGFTNAQNAFTMALGYQAAASPAYSAAIGLASNGGGSTTATGPGSMALGGSYASGIDSFSAAAATNSSLYGAQASGSVAIGFSARSNASNACAIGGSFNVASGSGSVAIGGTLGAQANGSCAVAIGGGANNASATADAQNSFALGDSAFVPTVKGKFAYSSDGAFVLGGAQYGNVVLRRQTTSATPSTLGSDANPGTSNNQVILPDFGAQAFNGLIVARQRSIFGTASAAWRVEGLIRREGGAATTTLVASTINTISNAPGWTIALSADTTNGGLAITVTGSATSIRWVATVQTSEVIYF